VTWDERVYELYGIPVETTVVFETFVNSLYPDDRQATLTLVQEAVAGKAEYDTEFRVIHPDGSIHFLRCYGVVVRDDQGNPLRVIGVNFEITEQKQAEQTIRQQAEKETLLRQIAQHIRQTLNPKPFLIRLVTKSVNLSTAIAWESFGFIPTLALMMENLSLNPLKTVFLPC
jgi:hypothetical protein